MTLSKNELQLSNGRLRSLFLHYALPGIGAMLFLAMQSIADGLIVGRLIVPAALAAVNVVIPISYIGDSGGIDDRRRHAGSNRYSDGTM